jgi:hypothetical protein
MGLRQIINPPKHVVSGCHPANIRQKGKKKGVTRKPKGSV